MSEPPLAQGTLSSPISQGRWKWRGGLQCDWCDSHWRQWSESPLRNKEGLGATVHPELRSQSPPIPRRRPSLSVVVLETPRMV